MRLSIIIPVYNVEKYLHKCLSSIINQTMTDFELILVNDGSKDSSLKICEEFAKKDNRISVYSIENHGSAYARNIGLEKAKGDYIGFVDSDDWIEPCMYEKLFEKAKEFNADIVSCSMKLIYENGREEIACINGDNGYYSREDIVKKIYPNLICNNYLEADWPFTMVLKIFKRSLIENNNIKFKDEFRLAQDYCFSCRCMYYANSFYFYKGEYYYYYRQNENSRTHKYLPGALKLLFDINDYLNNMTKNSSDYDFSNEIKFHRLQAALSAMTYSVKKGSDIPLSERGKLIENIIKNEIDRKTLYKLNYKKMVTKKKIICFLLTLKMYKFVVYLICKFS